MDEKRWVCHISGQGEKWEVVCDGLSESDEWRTIAPGRESYWILPKSEYRLCEPPEVWTEVPIEFIEQGMSGKCLRFFRHANNEENLGSIVFYCNGYRVKSLVIEKKEGL